MGYDRMGTGLCARVRKSLCLTVDTLHPTTRREYAENTPSQAQRPRRAACRCRVTNSRKLLCHNLSRYSAVGRWKPMADREQALPRTIHIHAMRIGNAVWG